jgi:NTE family protein
MNSGSALRDPGGSRVSFPDVLVLGGGGILGEAWMSAVLCGLDEAPGFASRGCGCYVGTSAGSIVATLLVAGLAPAGRVGRLPEPPAAPVAERRSTPLAQALDLAGGLGGAVATPLAALALSTSAPGGALVRRAALRRVPHGRRALADLGREVERSGARWDGRLRIATVELETGRRVVFGAPGAPALSVAAAVQASCAIPGVFRPVRAGGRSYVDGGVWSPTNMDAAEVQRGDQVLCLNPTGSFRPTMAEPVGVVGPVSRAVAAAEALVLRRRGATVITINPDDASVAAMGTNLMDPRRRSAVFAAGVAQGRRLARQRQLA